jgi:uncharacterized protein
MAKISAEYWIQHLNMQPHPEGGHFMESYRSYEQISGMHIPARYKGKRAFSTGIYFLVEKDNFSALHKLQSDEMWHFYTGNPLTVYSISPEGELTEMILGPDPEKGHVFQAVVPMGHWFGSRVNEGDFALVGCTVAPGFDFSDFELAKRAELLKLFPEHEQLILSLTR